MKSLTGDAKNAAHNAINIAVYSAMHDTTHEHGHRPGEIPNQCLQNAIKNGVAAEPLKKAAAEAVKEHREDRERRRKENEERRKQGKQKIAAVTQLIDSSSKGKGLLASIVSLSINMLMTTSSLSLFTSVEVMDAIETLDLASDLASVLNTAEYRQFSSKYKNLLVNILLEAQPHELASNVQSSIQKQLAYFVENANSEISFMLRPEPTSSVHLDGLANVFSKDRPFFKKYIGRPDIRDKLIEIPH